MEFGASLPLDLNYYMHLLRLSNRISFALGYRISQRVQFTANLLILAAPKVA